MGRKSSLQVSSEPIINYFQNSHAKSFSERAIHKVFDENRWSWNLSKSTSKKQFISFLLDNEVLEKKALRDRDGKTRPIYFIPGFDNLTIYTGLKKRSLLHPLHRNVHKRTNTSDSKNELP